MKQSSPIIPILFSKRVIVKYSRDLFLIFRKKPKEERFVLAKTAETVCCTVACRAGCEAGRFRGFLTSRSRLIPTRSAPQQNWLHRRLQSSSIGVHWSFIVWNCVLRILQIFVAVFLFSYPALFIPGVQGDFRFVFSRNVTRNIIVWTSIRTKRTS